MVLKLHYTKRTIKLKQVLKHFKKSNLDKEQDERSAIAVLWYKLLKKVSNT